MATVKFNLRNKNADQDQIWLIFRNGEGKALQLYTGQRIKRKYWSDVKQLPKTSYEDYHSLTDLLGHIKKVSLDAERECRIKGEHFTKEYLKNQITSSTGKDSNSRIDFKEALVLHIELKKETTKENTYKKFQTLRSHLVGFEKLSRTNLSFENVNQDFVEKYRLYMIGKGLLNSTIEKSFSHLRTFLKWCFEKEYTKNEYYKTIRVKRIESDIIVLTYDEYEQLLNFNFFDNEKYQRARDAFCFMCLTGLRYEDARKLSKDHIKKGFIKIKTEKTADIVIIPILPDARVILERNDYSFKLGANQTFNRAIKEVCKTAGIDAVEIEERYSGVQKITKKAPKYSFISAHTARRTFITLLLKKGVSAPVIMKMTGHKDFKTMKKYISLDQSDIKEIVDNAWKNKVR